MSRAAAAAVEVTKVYGKGDAAVTALGGVSVSFASGEFSAIMGPSGSGKSTLLHCLAGLDSVTSGHVFIGDVDLTTLKEKQLTRLRRDKLGFIFQSYNLLPQYTVVENIALPAVIAGEREASYRARVDEVIELVGLTQHRDKQPAQLSGGQQQRAAIARALFIRPALLLADEPTGNLDLASGAEVLGLFLEAQRAFGQTVVMVTHDPRSAGYADRVLLLRDGQVRGELDVTARCRGGARTDRTHEGRTRAVLRWLEDLDATGASSTTRRRARAEV